MLLNPLKQKDLKILKDKSKIVSSNGPEYLKLQGADLAPYKDIEINRLERIAKIVRGLIFATVEGAGSGHPGGSSSKVEQFLALALGGTLAFDPADPKHPGRDRVVWSAGHCTPLLFGGQALLYEALRRTGRQFSEAVVNCVLPEQLFTFRRLNGLPGHAESQFPFCDYSTGPSGHGFCAAGGMAISHRASGLPTKAWVFMGDAESEEGMTFEARNVLAATGTDNIIVTLDYNHFGIDGPIEEAMGEPYLNYWFGFGWNVIEVDGHNINELMYAYDLAAHEFKNSRPTVVIAHTIKGKSYGKLENTATSHGSPTSHEEYVKLVRKLGFNITGNSGGVAADMEKILETLSDDDCIYIEKCFARSAANIEAESELVSRMKKNLKSRPMVDPRSIKRPKILPAELTFKAGEKIGLRKAAEAWFEWLMKKTAFFYAGAGDLSKSVLTGKAEKVYGLIGSKNSYGRGIRFGIAEQNMAMMSMGMTQDILPGGFRPISVFGTYAVFTAMYGHAAHLALVANAVNPKIAGFFIALASHDGPETGEDGPTHQGMFWQSLFKAYPGIKVYKPTDANEVVEMLFAALEIGEPIILALPRSEATVLKRGAGVPGASAAAQGAYVYKPFVNNGKKRIVLAVSGAVILNNTLEALPQITKRGFDVKVVVVTSPELYEELLLSDPSRARSIISDEEKEITVTIHNGWPGFLDEMLLSSGALKRRVGIRKHLKSGRAAEVVAYAGLDAAGIVSQVLSNFK